MSQPTLSPTPIYDQLKGELLVTFPDDNPPDENTKQVDPLTANTTNEEQ
jgi:hypothetical protein